MDILRLAIESLFLFAIGLLAQAPQENSWSAWARGVNERLARGESALQQTEQGLRQAEQSLSKQQTAMVKLVRALDEMPSTVSELRAKADEIARQQGQLQATLDQVKNKQAEPPAEAECIWARMGAITGGVSILLSVVLIGLVYQIHRDPVKLNETGSVTTGG